TRIIIELEDSVQYSSARIANPDRIFFDLHAARITPDLAKYTIQTDGKLLSGIRVAQNQSGVVRVVLDVNGVKDYTASLTHNPTQLLIDLYAGPAKATQTAMGKKPVASEAVEPQAETKGPVETANDVKPEKPTDRESRKKGGAIVASAGVEAAPPMATPIRS